MNFFCYAADGASDDTLAEISGGYGISIYDHPPSDGLYLYADSEGISLCKAGKRGVCGWILSAAARNTAV